MTELSVNISKVRAAAEVAKRLRSVSFSLYGEDVVLSHLKPEGRGFYVDVGAYQPIAISNTYKLYLKGWRGITIEPNPDMSSLFRKLRPGDIHLQMGVASEPGELTYYRADNPGENTFDPDRAMTHRGKSTGSMSVPCLPLSQILAMHAQSRRIDLLNVDCEARDLEVLRSLDWERTRPTSVIVEDLSGFGQGKANGNASAIREFMFGLDYAVAAQCVFSFIYVDRTAFGRPPDGTGFRLADSQLGGLRA